MARLIALLRDKAATAGLTINDHPDPDDPTTFRAISQPVARRGRTIAAQREALRTLRAGLKETTR